MASSTKDTIYIDVDDEITGVIDKVSASPHKIVALVLPKRATVLQSIVNMKLLKRSADEAKKQLVLITGEAGLVPLAGAVGLHVAKSLQTKPYVPSSPTTDNTLEMLVSEPETEEAAEPLLDATKPVGELAGLPPASSGEDDAIELDNQPPAPAAAATTAAAGAKKSKKPKIPNFERFRTRLLLGAALIVLLIIGLILANIVLPRATIAIKTDTTDVNSTIDFTASTTTKEFDAADKVLPAELKDTKKTDTGQAPATGQKDQGTRASGSVTMSTSCGPTVPTIPAGTGVSAGGLTFITQTDAPLTTTSVAGGHCTFNGSVNVVAQQNGDQYNLGPRSDYTVAGYSGVSAADSKGMSGGTSKIVKVVSDADVAAAKAKISGGAADNAKNELRQALNQDGYFGMNETFISGTPEVTNNPNVGDTADQVTVTVTTTYSLLGVRQSDLQSLIDANLKKQGSAGQQKVQDYGLAKATFQVNSRRSPGQANVTMQATSTVGPQLDVDDLKRQIAGKKKGDAKAVLQAKPGVQDVTISYKPFWVSKTPKNTGHITIVLTKANGKP